MNGSPLFDGHRLENKPPDFDFQVSNVLGTHGDERQTGDGPWSFNTDVTWTVGETYSGRIAQPFRGKPDRDLIKVYLNEGQAYWFWGTGDESSDTALKDPQIVVYDPGGEFVTSNDDQLFPYNAAVIFEAQEAGYYYLGIHTSSDAEDPDASGDYKLRISEVDFSGGDESTVDLQPGRPKRLGIGEDYTAALKSLSDRDVFAFDLNAGETYELSARGVFNGMADDIGARLRGPDGKLVTFSEANGAYMSTEGRGPDVMFEVTPEKTGQYTLEINAEPGEVGYYRISSRLKEEAGGPLDALETDGLSRLTPEDTNDPVRVYFAPEGADIALTWDTLESHGFTATERAGIREVLDEVVSLTGQSYTVTQNRGLADVVISKNFAKNGRSFVETPFLRDEVDQTYVILNADEDQWQPGSLSPGGWMRYLIAHEIGHALGLAHPHDTGGGSELMAGQARGITRDFGLDQSPFTVMSYSDVWDEFENFKNAGESSWNGYLDGFGALDIALLQRAYGSGEHATGNTTYTLGSSTALRTIWDTAGEDLLVYNGSNDATLDLRAATLKYEEGGGGWVSHAKGKLGGYTIAAGVTLENARSGSGDDVVTGNDADNRLEGGAGSDVITGHAGRDHIIAGIGHDTLVGGRNDDRLVGDGGHDRLDSGDGHDVLEGGAGADTLLGGRGKDTMDGGAGRDRLDGGAGDDSLTGGEHNDWLSGGLHHDWLSGGNGNDMLAGGAGNDSLLGGGQRDSLSGGAGNDLLRGGGGDDRVSGQNGKDVLYGEAGSDQMFGGVGADRLIGDGGRDRLFGGANRDTLSGGRDDDVLSGDGGDDQLVGHHGNDTLDGGAGADLLTGGTGDDVFLFRLGGGRDRVLDFGRGDDVLHLTGVTLSDLSYERKNGNLFITYGEGDAIILVGRAGVTDIEDALVFV